MCFGMQTTSQNTTSATPNASVANAATSNLGIASNSLANATNNTYGTEYTGQLVAPLSGNQQSTINNAQSIANNGTGAAATGLIDNVASAAPQSVSANTISSAMSPYMNQYVMQALAPQLQQMNIQNAATNQATDAQATASGAYGDARTGIQQSNNAFNQAVQQEGVIGNAYNSAFNTAIGAGAQDVSNNLTAQTTNANLANTQLQNQLTGATDLAGLQTQQLGAQTSANTLAQQNTAENQAGLTANYNNWLQAQQSQLAALGGANSTVAAGATAMPATTTSTTQQPNNSGLALLGALGGGLLGNAGLGASLGNYMFGTSVNTPTTTSDIRVKDDIDEIGALRDGTPVYRFRYIDDPKNVTRIGLMAQDVEKRRPDAVHELPSGIKTVDYRAATELSRALALAA